MGFGLVWGLSREPKLAVGTGVRRPSGRGPGLARLGTGEAGRGNLLFLVLVCGRATSAPTSTGRLIGGPKLAPALSPGKTWSGAVGGLVCAIAARGWPRCSEPGPALLPP